MPSGQDEGAPVVIIGFESSRRFDEFPLNCKSVIVMPLLALPIDPRDPAWPVVARLPGLTNRMHLVARGALPTRRRPIAFA